VVLWLALACGPRVEPEPTIGVLTTVAFARAEDGVSEGFDLDATTTADGDPTGCGIADYTDPDGAVGIDNGFAGVIPALMATEAQAVEPLIQNAINSGALLLLFRVDGLADDGEPVDDAAFTLFRAQGTPSLGTDGYLEPSQTFEADPSIAETTVEPVAYADGELVARPIEIALPVSIFDVDYVFRMHDGAFRLIWDEDGRFHGTFGGGVDDADILSITENPNVDSALGGILAQLLAVNSDLQPDGSGICQRIAITFEFEGQRAYVFEEDTGQ
jgi:hypothetical protein